jgi:hypothetical protein
MPRKQSADTAKQSVQDVPSGGFSCGSYLDGHNVLYVPVMKLAPDLVPESARLRWKGDQLVLTTDSGSAVVHHHNPAGVRRLIGDFGAKCRWYPTLRLACWPRTGARHWVSLSLTEVTPCVSGEQQLLDEEEYWS